MSGWTTRLLTGAAEYLAAAGIGVWRPDGVYTLLETGIYLKTMPTAPDLAIVLATYPVDDSGAPAGDVTVGMQVRARAGRDPRSGDDLADVVYETFAGLAHVELGDIHVSQVVYRFGENLAADVGADTNGRFERVDTYYLYAARSLPRYS